MLRWDEDLPLGAGLPSMAGATEWINGEAPAVGGQPVLVHFWAVSSPYSVRELPRLSRWASGYAALVLVGVHMPMREEDTDVRGVASVAREMGVGHPIAIDNEHAVAEAFRVPGVPSYYLFDSEGRLRFQQYGPGSETLGRAVEQVMMLAPPAE